MTYRELRDKLNSMGDRHEWIDSDVSVVLLDTREAIPLVDFVVDPWERYPAQEHHTLGFDIVDGVLDEDHPFLTIVA